MTKYKREIWLLFILTACALVVASFFDLKIDILLNNPKGLFANWFCNTGEMPSRLICPLAGAVIFFAEKKKILKIFGLIVNIGGGAYLGYHIAHYFFKADNNLIFGAIFGIGISVTILAVFTVIPREKIEKLKVLAYIGIIVMIVQLSTIEGVKYLWGRVRFRDLLKNGSYDAFTPWYHPNGINLNKSFPSGHTAGAGMSYLLMMLPFASEKAKKHYKTCFYLPMIYTGMVAFSRLIMGAHYLSDVAVGGVISFIIVLVAMKIYEKRLLKN